MVLLLLLAVPGMFGSTCIVEGSLVETPDGSRPIQDLKVGDEVWSRGRDGRARVGRITRVLPARAFRYLRITFTDGSALCATAPHPIATPEGWIPAGQLAAGRMVDGPKTVASIESIYSPTRVFDLEVEPDANFVVAGVLVHNKSNNDRNAQTSLKTLALAQDDFRANDGDGNRITDYWVGDVAHLYTLKRIDGSPIGLIEKSISLADTAPLGDQSEWGERWPKAAYNYATIPLQADGRPYDDGSHRHRSRFAVCAWPDNPMGGRYTYIVNQENTIYRKELPQRARIMRWPADPEAEGWSKLD